jgi:hypothetical protein
MRKQLVRFGMALVLVIGLGTAVVLSQGSEDKVKAAKGIKALKAACEISHGKVILGGQYCTHGNDENVLFERLGDASKTCVPVVRLLCLTPPILPTPTPTPKPSPTPSPLPGCGADINRIQAVYLRKTSQSDKLSERVGTFSNAVSDADNILNKSADRDGHTAHLRMVTDGSCHLIIKTVVSDQSMNSFQDEIKAVSDAGYNRPDYVYLIFPEDDFGCGIGSLVSDSQPDPLQNQNNNQTHYSSIYPGCVNGPTVLHELTHNMGAVQLDAPNSDGSWHCDDEFDIMCYGPNMRYVCSGSELLDCGRDDYFAFRPQSSYLADHWNVVHSRWLDTK